jgi:glycosyltransferase involved in cell wall biosynthesis
VDQITKRELQRGAREEVKSSSLGEPSKGESVAHFLHVPGLSLSPPNEALISAYLALGYAVDVYAPGECKIDEYGPAVTSLRAEYGKRWLVRNAWNPKWRRYSAFSGTSEDPLATVGVLSALHRRPAIALADEIRSGSYRGNRSASWKKLCRFGMRRARLTIVNDHERIELQRAYANLRQDQPVIVYPGGYRNPPPPVERGRQRRIWGLPLDGLVIGASGAFNLSVGADWLVEALMKRPDVYGVIQPPGMDPLARFLLGHIAGCERIYVEPRHLAWQEAWSQAAALDIGMVVYTNPAPQFQLMGTSSNRLCMFLAMGVPVIASRQDSFRFLERYDCGVLVDDSAGFSVAIEQIRARLPDMKANALRCWREYVATPQRYQELLAALRSALGE